MTSRNLVTGELCAGQWVGIPFCHPTSSPTMQFHFGHIAFRYSHSYLSLLCSHPLFNPQGLASLPVPCWVFYTYLLILSMKNVASSISSVRPRQQAQIPWDYQVIPRWFISYPALSKKGSRSVVSQLCVTPEMAAPPGSPPS